MLHLHAVAAALFALHEQGFKLASVYMEIRGFIARRLFSMGAVQFLLEFLWREEHDLTSNETRFVSTLYQNHDFGNKDLSPPRLPPSQFVY